jgi:hypothetical protein
MPAKHEKELSDVPRLLREIAKELNPEGRRLNDFPARVNSPDEMRSPADVARERQASLLAGRLSVAAEIIEDYLGDRAG